MDLQVEDINLGDWTRKLPKNTAEIKKLPNFALSSIDVWVLNQEIINQLISLKEKAEMVKGQTLQSEEEV